MTDIYKTPEGARAVLDLYRKTLDAWPVAHEERRMATSQGETFVVMCGDPAAPPLVLLHGAQANSATWLGDAAIWGRRFRVHAVDVIGEPGFSAPARPPLDTDAHARWLDDVMDGLGLSRAMFVGISLGGWLVLDYAVRRPDRVSALAVLCPAGVGPQKWSILFKVLALRLLGGYGRRRAAAAALGTPMDTLPASAEAAAIVTLMQLIFRHFRGRVVKFPLFSDAELQGLKMPCLAVVGGRDALFDADVIRRRLEQNVPGLDMRFLPDTGHLITGQTDAIGAFLEDAVRRAA